MSFFPPTLHSIVLVLLVALLSGCGISNALRVQDHSRVPVAAMVNEVAESRLVFVGEVHDNSSHHKVQLQVVKALYEYGGSPLAIGMEIFSARTQPYLDGWSDGGLSQWGFERLYQQEWRSVPYEQYEGIFDYAREKRIPLIGLNVPLDTVKKVARSGFASLTEAERIGLPDQVSCNVNPEYRRFIQTMYSGHGHPGFNFEFFCEAQILWNRGMALNLEKYLARNPTHRVVVLTGGGHSLRKWGIPDQLPSELQSGAKVIIPEIDGISADNVTTGNADYLLLEENKLVIDNMLGF